MRGKHIIGDFELFFGGASTFFNPKLSCAQRMAILVLKKVEAPSKNYEKSPIMCFASIQKSTGNITNSGALLNLGCLYRKMKILNLTLN
jgi:hypothetical protein